MKSEHKYIVNILVTGFVILTILSVLFFWARKTCQAIFYENLVVGRARQIRIQPSGLFPDLDNGPNDIIQSYIEAYIGDGVVSHGLGIVQDIGVLENRKSRKFSIINKYKDKRGCDLILFDKNSGLFAYFDVSREKRRWNKKAKLYAGPKGVSRTADKNLGRFSGPHKNLWRGHIDSVIFFDKSHSCFFQIRFHEEAVFKGPQLPGDYNPIQIGGFSGFEKDSGSLGPLTWSPPLRKGTAEDKKNKKNIRMSTRDKDGQRIVFVSAAEEHTGTYSKEDILVLENNGEIRRLDSKTLELSAPVGFLPSAVDSVGRAKPEELFAYAVQPFVVNDEYSGTIAASISREAMEIQVAVFDKDGKLIERKGAHINPFSMAGGPALTILNYLLEDLQPALLGLVSYFTASTFEAVDGHTGLFILPNSLVAIFSRLGWQNREAKGIVSSLFGAMIIIFPSIVLGLLLAWRVRKDSTIVGLSAKAKLCWLIGTIAFGISAYITYRLTRPTETLVTCQNCGKLRRPDMATCHRCGSKWNPPELIPPVWRVTGPELKDLNTTIA